MELSTNQITALKPAIKDKTRVNVFVDGKFKFSLTLSQLSDAGLKIGQVLTPDELESLKSESDFGKLYQRTLEYVLTRPHSEKEVRDYLIRKQLKRELDQKRYDEFLERLKNDPEYREKVKALRQKVREKNQQLKSFEEDNRFEFRGRAKTGLPTKPGAPITTQDIERVIKKLKENRAVDDAEFAHYFVANRDRLKGTSIKKLRFELKQKGISDSLISEALSADESGELPRNDAEEIDKILAKKLRTALPSEPEARVKLKQKLLALLVRQGFSYGLSKSKLDEAFSGDCFSGDCDF